MPTETLRPDADTATVEWTPKGGGDHYVEVDEESHDDYTTYVETDGESLTELFDIQDSALDVGTTINKVTLYAWVVYHNSGNYSAACGIKSGATEDWEDFWAWGSSFAEHSIEYATDPNTGSPWTVAAINALQIGVKTAGYPTAGGRCTQIYVEVDYTPVEKTSSDTGSGAETSAEEAAYSRDETGSGADANTGNRGFILPETGSGVEHILDRVLVLISESGSGIDTVLSLLGKVVTESGTGVENSYLHILEGVKDSSDSGSGVEASTLTTLLQRDETGSGVDTVVARALYAKEYPTGAIDLAKVLTAVITGTGETGTGAEASLVSFYQKKADSGIGVDASTLAALFTRDETGAGAEAITLLAAMIASDVGQSVDTVLNYLRTLVDSGTGEEVVQLIGAVGRRMRMVVYQREAFNLEVYTSEVGR